MGIKEDINELKQAILVEGRIVEKKHKLPFGKKVGKGQKKKNYVTTLVINENGHYEFKKYQIQDQTVIHDLIPRIAGTGYVMHDSKGNPLIILPNWSVEPFSPLDHYEKSMANGQNTNGYKILMAKMEQNKVDGKKSLGKILPWIMGLGLAAIIIYAIFTGGGN